jgi:hypothetical protein
MEQPESGLEGAGVCKMGPLRVTKCDIRYNFSVRRGSNMCKEFLCLIAL